LDNGAGGAAPGGGLHTPPPPTPQVRDQLQIIQVPDPLQTLATYPIAVAKGNNAAGGEAFVAYMLGPQGQATLAKWGFLPPTQTSAAATTGAPQDILFKWGFIRLDAQPTPAAS
jgi:ABC-type Fe3+ transport system substrate-binding protein